MKEVEGTSYQHLNILDGHGALVCKIVIPKTTFDISPPRPMSTWYSRWFLEAKNIHRAKYIFFIWSRVYWAIFGIRFRFFLNYYYPQKSRSLDRAFMYRFSVSWLCVPCKMLPLLKVSSPKHLFILHQKVYVTAPIPGWFTDNAYRRT